MLPLMMLVIAATPTPSTAPKPATTAQTPAGSRTLVEAVAERMSPQGRAIFERYAAQTLTPLAKSNLDAEIRYRQALQALVGAPKLDVDAASRLIEQRKQAEMTATSAIRASAYTMLKSLPEGDRKLALTAIFVDARPPRPQGAPGAAPGASPKK